jgi:hypothetical protein
MGSGSCMWSKLARSIPIRVASSQVLDNQRQRCSYQKALASPKLDLRACVALGRCGLGGMVNGWSGMEEETVE